MDLPSVKELSQGFDAKFLIICVTNLKDGGLQVHHICSYPNEPTQEDVDQLWIELSTDEEFKLPFDVLDELEMRQYTIEMYQELLNKIKEDN